MVLHGAAAAPQFAESVPVVATFQVLPGAALADPVAASNDHPTPSATATPIPAAFRPVILAEFRQLAYPNNFGSSPKSVACCKTEIYPVCPDLFLHIQAQHNTFSQRFNTDITRIKTDIRGRLTWWISGQK